MDGDVTMLPTNPMLDSQQLNPLGVSGHLGSRAQHWRLTSADRSTFGLENTQGRGVEVQTQNMDNVGVFLK